MSHNEHCIFCRIVAGTVPCARIYEDELVLSFMDIAPVAHGHTLVIIKDHCENIFEARPDALAAVARVSQHLATAIRRALAPEGLVVAQLNGAAAGQTVFHYHMHLVPRSGGDPFSIHGRKLANLDELLEVADTIRQALAADA